MFNDYVVNSSTISSFVPETGFCDTIIGSVRIDDTTDLTHQQLTDVLEQVMFVTGNLTVVNTAFTNLSFLIGLYGVSSKEDQSGVSWTAGLLWGPPPQQNRRDYL
ncbi:hypothetical protein Aduo_007296 [Ancylostoma duodenale]